MSRTPTEVAAPEPAAGSGMGCDESALNRRDFLRLGGAMAAATAMSSAGCKMPSEELVPFHERPEDANTPGKARFFATVLDGSPVLARTRESRPILITPNVAHPSPRGLTLRSHAALLDLYDPDRAMGPLSVRRGKGGTVETSWQQVSQQLVSRLSQGRGGKGASVLLTPPLSGPATRAVVQELGRAAQLTHVSYAPVANDAEGRAWSSAFGDVPKPRARLDRASVVVGLGAEFIDQPADGLEGDFARRRAPDGELPMSYFVQFEGRLTLTGANADRRIRVRDSQLYAVAAAIAHEIVIANRLGPLADDEAALAALRPFTAEAVAKVTSVDAGVLKAVAERLMASAGESLCLAGGTPSASASGVALELAVIVINHSLGAYDSPLFDWSLAERPRHGGAERLAELAAKMQAGGVSTLIVAGANPVYDAPAGTDFAAAMSKVQFVLSLNDRVDETSLHADWLAPASHPLEAWEDVALGGGLVAVAQPVLRPLYDTYGLLDVLVTWGARLGLKGDVARAVALAKPQEGADPAAATGAASAAYHYLRAYWGRHYLRDKPDTPAFEDRWNEVLRKGHFRDSEPAAPKLTWSSSALEGLGTPQAASGLELSLYPHFALHDGRSGNNGWLLESADPITRITWDGAASIAPRRFDEMGLENGDLVELTVGAGKLTLPAYRHAGMHHDQVAVALGQGRTRVGLVGDDVGVNAFKVQSLTKKRVLRAGLRLELRKAGGRRPLAMLQQTEVIDRDRRPLVPTTTLSRWQADPRAGTGQTPGGPSAWPEHHYLDHRWGMAIDLSKCNGCGKCTLACQAENNVPVVGPQGIRDGRAMAWIRIDRYYDAPRKDGRWTTEVWDGPLEVVEEPITLFEPMMCQHCENAPCETVCPFNATMHSSDGLNQQIYNRCVGTRYCANNCPFKVRRFNWFEYSFAQSSTLFRLLFPVIERNARLNTRGKMPLKNNPEVTVRSRGVMEKCSFCVQRIREARSEAARLDRKGVLPDGAVVPACMEACPTGAITFGDVNDPNARVAALSQSPRAMRLLEVTGVKPAVSYLTKVRNDNA